MVRERGSGDRRGRWSRAVELAGLALLSYLPFLLSSPGRVTADSKQYLYLDVGRFLQRVPYLWDEQVGAGGVSHQQIGYLFPMGPWFWVMERLGLEVWVAQRLWLGTLTLLAGIGTRWLLRHLGLGAAGALAGALVYMLTPYQLAFTARASVLLLPWVGLPWLIGLADRASKRGGWRDPALFALVVLSIGSVNASSLVLAGVGPVAWMVAAALSRRGAWRAVVAAAVRIGLLSAGVSLWWIVGLRLEAAYGLPVLQVTERLESVAATSSPLDVLRGLGNWFFYGRDRLGYSIDQASYYLTHTPTIAASFAIPVLGLAAAVALRWRHRARFVMLVVVGAVVAVGAWPLEDPSPFARLVGAFTEDTSAGLALRNTARTVPVLVLGLAGLVAAGVEAWPAAVKRIAGASLVGVVALAALWPVASTGYLSDNMDRQDPLPSYWYEAAAALDAQGDETRVLELPGSNFAAFRWGNAVDPILPGLMDRSHVAREVLPLGSVGSTLLVDALDRRLQEGWLDVDAVAPVARLLAAGTVVVRGDLQYERFLTPRPDLLWDLFAGADVAGLGEPVTFGEGVANQPVAALPSVDELALRRVGAAGPAPAVALFDVEDPAPILRLAPEERPVVIAGDGDGIVDAASAGILDGRSLLLQVASLDDEELARALEAGADLVLTDTNRRRIQTWFYAIRDTRGPTEQAGETMQEPTGYDHRLEPFPGAGDDSRTVVEQVGGTVSATSSGGAPRPEDRPVAAADRNTTTSWRVGGANPAGNALSIRLDEPVRTDRIVLLQPQDGPRDRRVQRVRVRLDGEELEATLGPESFEDPGQTVRFPPRQVSRVDVELLEVTVPPFDPAVANAVGFAEVSIGGAQVREVVRPPVDLLERTEGGAGHALDVVLTRLRYEPGEAGRLDQELWLDRSVDLPRSRSFGLSGTARINPDAGDAVIDELLGTSLGGARVTSTERLTGDLEARASRALDGDPDTWWQSSFGPGGGESISIDLAGPTQVGELTVEVVDDPRHSRPSTMSLVTDRGVRSAVVEVPAPGPDGRARVTFPAPAEPVTSLSLRIESAEPRTAVAGDTNPAAQLPVAIAEISGAGLPVATDPARVPAVCRDLLVVDGQTVSARVEGPVSDARRGLQLVPCDEAGLDLQAGRHEIVGPAGATSGIDVDQLVLSSAPDGSATSASPRGARRADAGATVRSIERGPTSMEASVTTDGEPFWLVLGQSSNDGWELDVDGGRSGPRRLVDGYANGWLVEPGSAGEIEVSLRWAPQRQVWVGLAVSAAVVAVCAAIVTLTWRRHGEAEPATDRPSWAFGSDGAVARGRLVAGSAVAAVSALVVATPAAALVAVAAVVALSLAPALRPLWVVAAPAAVVAGHVLDRPLLAWLALAVVAGDQLARWARRSDPSAEAIGSVPQQSRQ